MTCARAHQGLSPRPASCKVPALSSRPLHLLIADRSRGNPGEMLVSGTERVKGKGVRVGRMVLVLSQVNHAVLRQTHL